MEGMSQYLDLTLSYSDGVRRHRRITEWTFDIPMVDTRINVLCLRPLTLVQSIRQRGT